jgi:hypothetical protein
MNRGFPNKKHTILKTAVDFLGLGLGAEVVNILTKDKFNILRAIQTQILTSLGKEAGVEEKDWVCEADACDFCQGLADGSPYDTAVEFSSHPNCRCSWSYHTTMNA